MTAKELLKNMSLISDKYLDDVNADHFTLNKSHRGAYTRIADSDPCIVFSSLNALSTYHVNENKCQCLHADNIKHQ